MNRRRFLTSGAATALAASALAHPLRSQEAVPGAESQRQYYELRRYHLRQGPPAAAAGAYFQHALIPALNRHGVQPVGAFTAEIGDAVGSPSVYLLMPAANAEVLAKLHQHLERDGEYQKAGAAFLHAPAREPDSVRWESALLYALEAMPKLEVPPRSAAGVFELRTYESTTARDHHRKIEMMNAGEREIFQEAKFWPVFMGDTLIGGRQPCLTYLIGFPALADRDRYWNAFRASPKWKALTANPRYSFEPLVSNIDNVILTPTPYSQI